MERHLAWKKWQNSPKIAWYPLELAMHIYCIGLLISTYQYYLGHSLQSWSTRKEDWIDFLQSVIHLLLWTSLSPLANIRYHKSYFFQLLSVYAFFIVAVVIRFLI